MSFETAIHGIHNSSLMNSTESIDRKNIDRTVMGSESNINQPKTK